MVGVVLLPLAGEPLVLVAGGPLLDELCRGALGVQARAETAPRLAFVGPLGLRQHGALKKTQAGQVL